MDQDCYVVTRLKNVAGLLPESTYIKVLFNPNENNLFVIEIFHKRDHWSGSFSNESAETNRIRLNETKEQYIENLEKALREENHQFKYEFVLINDNIAKFSWKKKFENSTAVMVHGTVDLNLSPIQDKDSLINFLLDKNLALKRNLEVCNKSNETLRNDLQACKSEFEKLIDIKSSLETTLYGKFAQVLNSKKRRIQLLEDSLENTV